MDLNLQTGDASSATLTKALLLYGNSRNQFVYASMHEVEGKNPTIMPGVALTSEALGDALNSLMEGSGERRWRSIDTSVIASGAGLLAWWSPSRVRYQHFHSSSKVKSGNAIQPPMFWVAYRKNLYVFTLKTNERPTMKTELHHSVHFNVYEAGNLCIGTGVVPADLEIEKWEAMFYESMFTHPHGGPDWQTSLRGGSPALWRKLNKEEGKKPFPLELLKPTNQTVEQLLDRVSMKGYA